MGPAAAHNLQLRAASEILPNSQHQTSLSRSHALGPCMTSENSVERPRVLRLRKDLHHVLQSLPATSQSAAKQIVTLKRSP